MNFFCDSGGNIFHVDSENVYQGSANANTIYFIGAFPSTSVVWISYQLPNKAWTEPVSLTNVFGENGEFDGYKFNVWKIDVKDIITQYEGIVSLQFFVYGFNGARIATALSSFNVLKGIPLISETDDDSGSTLAEISALKSRVVTLEEGATEKATRLDGIEDTVEQLIEFDTNANATLGELTAEVNNLKEITYIPISISSFVISPTYAEKGSEVSEVTAKWSTNKEPVSLTINDEDIDAKSNEQTFSGVSIKENTEYKLTCSDGKTTASKTLTLQFLSATYYGTKPEPETYDSAFIKSLQKDTLRASKTNTIEVTASKDQYIYYCVPSSLENLTFQVGMLEGGFVKITEIQFTNDHGHNEQYDIYRSDETELGKLEIKIS